MEARLRKLEARFIPSEAVQLRTLSAIAAEGTDLDPALILHEAEQVLARMRAAGPRSLAEIAADESIPVDDLVALMAQRRERWQAVG